MKSIFLIASKVEVALHEEEISDVGLVALLKSKNKEFKEIPKKSIQVVTSILEKYGKESKIDFSALCATYEIQTVLEEKENK